MLTNRIVKLVLPPIWVVKQVCILFEPKDTNRKERAYHSFKGILISFQVYGFERMALARTLWAPNLTRGGTKQENRTKISSISPNATS